ncbi:GPR1/FUN34/yaaH family-domain-containing protein [Lipomyces doorenjongii]|uniref:GPR1/FUN34/yaaH family-domain-containing protein n=1 Tax=Lipomyces doorenjongii TaxID=383834 RepID=UPI003343CC03
MTSNDSTASSSTPPPDKEAIDLEGQTTNHKVSHIENHAADPDLIKIGDAWVSRLELIHAFGGTLNPGLATAPSRKFANPAPLGLCAFGLTTFVLCMANVQARGVTNPSVVIGCAYFYGGFIQLCAGMWEMVLENTFGATALSSFGGFWLAFGAIETDAFGIVSAYGDDINGLNNMLAFFLIAWFIFTFGLVLCTLRSTVAFFLLFFTLDLAFLLLGIGHLYPTDGGAPNVGVTKAGGVFGLLSAFFAWYNAFAGLATKENSLITVRPIPMPWNLGYRATKTKSG